MYSRPSASQMCDPAPRSMISGSLPTARKARTGLFTPPTRIFCARSKSSEDLLTLESYYEDRALGRAHFYFALQLQHRPIPVRQICEHRVPRRMRAQRLDYHRQRIGQNIRKGALFGETQAKRQLLDRRAELGVDARLVAARGDSIPAELRKMDGVQSVQGVRSARVVDTQTLIAESCGNVVGAQQSRQQMALRVAIAGAREQRF